MLIQERGQREVEAEIADLVGAHRRELLDLCQRRLGGDRHLAEDVVQETFLKLGRALSSGQEIQNPRAWLRTVASHGTVDELRRRKSMVLVEPPDTIGVEDVTLDGASAELEAAWKVLNPRHREVLRLRELEGLHYDEIATAMATRVSAVETLLFRARSALRREYSRAAEALTTAQAQLAAAPLVAQLSGGGEGWLPRIAAKVSPLAGGAGLVDALRAKLAEVAAAAALTTAVVGGGAAPAPDAPPIVLPAPVAVDVPTIPSPVVEVPSPSIGDVTAPTTPVATPSVPAAPEAPVVDQPEAPTAPSAAELVESIVATAVDAVSALLDPAVGLLPEILGSTARNG